METVELLEAIGRGEDSHLQFKENVTNPDQLASEMAAFANSRGGRILIGISDRGDISGLTAEDVHRINQLISNSASQNVREPLFPTTRNLTIGDKKIIVLDVEESRGKPHFDKNGVVWVKTGSDKRRVVSREELRRLFQDVDTLHADEMPISGTSINDLEEDAFAEFYERNYGRSLKQEFHSLKQILNNLNLAKDAELNLAGLLLFAKNPQRFRPVLVLKAVAFPGNDATATEYLESDDLTGTLPQIYDKARAFLARHLRRVQGGQSVNSLGTWEIPQIVQEELLVNMLVHRNYFIESPWRLFIFTDRVEFISPGALPNNLTVEHAINGNSIPRNPILQSFCSRGLLPYRGIGTGLQRVIKEAPDTTFYNDPERNQFRSVVRRRS
jgi:ATP-dependent DNA helicase RecG